MIEEPISTCITYIQDLDIHHIPFFPQCPMFVILLFSVFVDQIHDETFNSTDCCEIFGIQGVPTILIVHPEGEKQYTVLPVD